MFTKFSPVFLYAALDRKLLDRFPPLPHQTYWQQDIDSLRPQNFIVRVVCEATGRTLAEEEQDNRQTRRDWVSKRFVFI